MNFRVRQMKDRKRVILGIDPGFAILGYGVIEESAGEENSICFGCLRTSVKENFVERLEQIYKGVNSLIKEYKPDEIAIEKIFFAKNAKTAMQIGEVRGIILLTAIQNKVPIFEYTPLQVKLTIASYGQADKSQIQKMVKLILKLKEIPKPDDAADALAIAITHCHSKRK